MQNMLEIFHKNSQLTAYLWANSASTPISRPGCNYMSSGFKSKLGQRRPCKIPALSKRSPLPPNLPLHLTMPFVFFLLSARPFLAFGVHILLPYEAQIVPPTAAAKASQYVVAHSPSIMGNQEDEVRVELARGRGCCVVMLTWVFPKIDASQFAVCA